jgi:pyruvate kinase
MLESMVQAPRPTRAEASDVANAIFDGTDALMLSAETAVGKYPVEAVRMMSSLAESTERNIDYAALLAAKADWVAGNVTDAISYAACELAADIGAKAIVTATQTGTTARRVSKYRPPVPIIALSSDPAVVGQLHLSWGVLPIEVPPSRNVDETLAKAVDVAVKQDFVNRGDRIVITAGALVNVPGTTNLIKVEEIT